MLLQLLRTLAIAGSVFPFIGSPQRRALVHRLSRRLLATLAVRVTVGGEPPRARDVPVMIVANHVSWLDILAINAVHTVRFVAKSEIRKWPLVGWLSARVGTLFIEQTRRRHTAQINAGMVAAMQQGDTFAVFPEGYVSTGDMLRPFHASLLQPALTCNARLFPVAIRYTRADGSLCGEADFSGEKTMFGSLRLMLTQPVINAHLEFLPPIACDGVHRRELAREIERLIAGALNVPVPRRRAEKASRPPA
jgi:1-acyl-sn-glycerol-3-phosphate acyltransferase